jgi:hypothetical protein
MHNNTAIADLETTVSLISLAIGASLTLALCVAVCYRLVCANRENSQSQPTIQQGKQSSLPCTQRLFANSVYNQEDLNINQAITIKKYSAWLLGHSPNQEINQEEAKSIIQVLASYKPIYDSNIVTLTQTALLDDCKNIESEMQNNVPKGNISQQDLILSLKVAEVINAMASPEIQESIKLITTSSNHRQLQETNNRVKKRKSAFITLVDGANDLSQPLVITNGNSQPTVEDGNYNQIFQTYQRAVCNNDFSAFTHEAFLNNLNSDQQSTIKQLYTNITKNSNSKLYSKMLSVYIYNIMILNHPEVQPIYSIREAKLTRYSHDVKPKLGSVLF